MNLLAHYPGVKGSSRPGVSSTTVEGVQEWLEGIRHQASTRLGQGKVASYIPALSKQDANRFGIAICTNDGRVYAAGDAREPFSVQSISKVFLLTLSLRVFGNTLWERVGLNPSGMPFNSLIQLEAECGKPRNPFINAGAIVVADSLVSAFATPVQVIQDTARRLSGNSSILIDRDVLASEWKHRSRNAAMAYLTKAFGNINNEVDDVLHTYFACCSLSMNCVDLAVALNYLAADGYSRQAGEQFVEAELARRINSLLFTSGMYDAAGEFAYRVGLPAKSGVGGGIVAIVPGQFSVCAWSPALDDNGNSVVAQYALELLSESLAVSSACA